MAENPFDDPAFTDELKTIALYSDECRQIVSDVAKAVRDQAKILAPKRTGLMASKIKLKVADTTAGPVATVSAPAPANLLSTAKGIRHQTRAWGHRISLWHPAKDPFLKMARDAVIGLDDVPGVGDE